MIFNDPINTGYLNDHGASEAVPEISPAVEGVVQTGPHWCCGYCGAWNEGKLPELQRFVNFEDFPGHESLGLDTSDDVTQIGNFVLSQMEVYQGHLCPACKEFIDQADVEEIDTGWKCEDCDEIFDNQTDAAGCCAYYRRQRSTGVRPEVVAARALLEANGFTVR